MPTLRNIKHELFAQGMVRGMSAAQAYAAAGYSATGARANGSRLKRNNAVAARINEMKVEIYGGVVDAEIRNRSARVALLESQFNAIQAVIHARSIAYADDSLGASGLMIPVFRGRKGERVVGSSTRACQNNV